MQDSCKTVQDSCKTVQDSCKILVRFFHDLQDCARFVQDSSKTMQDSRPCKISAIFLQDHTRQDSSMILHDVDCARFLQDGACKILARL